MEAAVSPGTEAFVAGVSNLYRFGAVNSEGEAQGSLQSPQLRRLVLAKCKERVSALSPEDAAVSKALSFAVDDGQGGPTLPLAAAVRPGAGSAQQADDDAACVAGTIVYAREDTPPPTPHGVHTAASDLQHVSPPAGSVDATDGASVVPSAAAGIMVQTSAAVPSGAGGTPFRESVGTSALEPGALSTSMRLASMLTNEESNDMYSALAFGNGMLRGGNLGVSHAYAGLTVSDSLMGPPTGVMYPSHAAAGATAANDAPTNFAMARAAISSPFSRFVATALTDASGAQESAAAVAATASAAASSIRGALNFDARFTPTSTGYRAGGLDFEAHGGDHSSIFRLGDSLDAPLSTRANAGSRVSSGATDFNSPNRTLPPVPIVSHNAAYPPVTVDEGNSCDTFWVPGSIVSDPSASGMRAHGPDVWIAPHAADYYSVGRMTPDSVFLRAGRATDDAFDQIPPLSATAAQRSGRRSTSPFTAAVSASPFPASTPTAASQRAGARLLSKSRARPASAGSTTPHNSDSMSTRSDATGAHLTGGTPGGRKDAAASAPSPASVVGSASNGKALARGPSTSGSSASGGNSTAHAASPSIVPASAATGAAAGAAAGAATGATTGAGALSTQSAGHHTPAAPGSRPGGGTPSLHSAASPSVHDVGAPSSVQRDLIRQRAGARINTSATVVRGTLAPQSSTPSPAPSHMGSTVFSVSSAHDAASSHAAQATPRHQSTCHRCTSSHPEAQRVLCVSCPACWCAACARRATQMFGVDVFERGCPKCLMLCCCGMNPHYSIPCPAGVATAANTHASGVRQPAEDDRACVLPLHCRNCKLRPVAITSGVTPSTEQSVYGKHDAATRATSSARKRLRKSDAEDGSAVGLVDGVPVATVSNGLLGAGCFAPSGKLHFFYLITNEEAAVIVNGLLQRSKAMREQMAAAASSSTTSSSAAASSAPGTHETTAAPSGGGSVVRTALPDAPGAPAATAPRPSVGGSMSTSGNRHAATAGAGGGGGGGVGKEEPPPPTPLEPASIPAASVSQAARVTPGTVPCVLAPAAGAQAQPHPAPTALASAVATTPATTGSTRVSGQKRAKSGSQQPSGGGAAPTAPAPAAAATLPKPPAPAAPAAGLTSGATLGRLLSDAPAATNAAHASPASSVPQKEKSAPSPAPSKSAAASTHPKSSAAAALATRALGASPGRPATRATDVAPTLVSAARAPPPPSVEHDAVTRLQQPAVAASSNPHAARSAATNDAPRPAGAAAAASGARGSAQAPQVARAQALLNAMRAQSSLLGTI